MATARRKDLSAVKKEGRAHHIVEHLFVDEQDDQHLIYIMVSKLP